MKCLLQCRGASLALLLLLSCLVLFAKPRIVAWPGPAREYTSADGRYVLRNVDPANNEDLHSLFLRDRVQNREIKLLTYTRWVEALWSPEGSKLIINDHLGSNVAECRIYDLNRRIEPLVIDADVLQMTRQDSDVFANDHVYVECREWRGSGRVKIKIHGYGENDPRGFTLWLEYEVGKGSTVTKRIRHVKK